MSNFAWVLGAVVLAACGGDRLDQQAPPSPEVVVGIRPATEAQCPSGGSVIGSGLDNNHNGILDDTEIVNRTVVCNDPPARPPPTVVFRLVSEPPGTHCTTGGTAVQSGPDSNGNGRLDDGEIAHVDYVCGEVLLTRFAIEPPGQGCVAAGVAILLGRDRDHDGQLGDDEVEQTELVCGDAMARDVVIRTPDDAAALANIATITGSLTVAGSPLTALALPRLVQVRGAVDLRDNPALVEVRMPALQAVEAGFVLARHPQLTTVELPALHRTGTLQIDGNTALPDLSGLPSLRSVAGDLRITGNDALSSIDLPEIRVAGALIADDNAQVRRINLSLTGDSSAVHVASNHQLDSLTLGEHPVHGFIDIGRVTIASNERLAEIDANVERIVTLEIANNPALTRATISTFGISGDLLMRDNGPTHVMLSPRGLLHVLIGGSLHLSGPVAGFDITKPIIVGGDCTVQGTNLQALAHVQDVGGTLRLIDNPVLTTISFISVGGGLEVRSNALLPTLSFLLLDEIDGDLVVADNAALESMPSMAGLIQVRGDVDISSNPSLRSGFSSKLARVEGAVTLRLNDQLATPGLDGLERVGALAIRGCPAVTALDLPRLSEVATIDVRDNAVLEHLRIPALRRADIGVFDNPHLPACEVEALFAAIQGMHQQSGNDDTTPCDGEARP